MRIPKEVLLGKIPVTQDQLYYIAKKHVKYDLRNLDTSQIEIMKELFLRKYTFNQDISGWDVSNVLDMSGMFAYTTKFNQPIGGWDVGKVINMSGMFSRSKSFNQPIGDWNVSNVRIMWSMFYEAKVFNQPIGNWDVSNVKDMNYMFAKAENFNQPIWDWDISNVTNRRWMFDKATNFNQENNVKVSGDGMTDETYKLNRLRNIITLLNEGVFSKRIEKIICDASDVDVENTYQAVGSRLNVWKARLPDFLKAVKDASCERDKPCQRCAESPDEPCQFCAFAQAVVDRCVAENSYAEAVCEYLSDVLFDLDLKRKSK